MERFELIAPCHFGLEAVMKREILDLGYEVSHIYRRRRGRLPRQYIFTDHGADPFKGREL